MDKELIIKFIPLIGLLLMSCNLNQNSTQEEPSKFSCIDSLKVNLLGQWGGLKEDSPVWDIRKDSIYYFERSAAYPYRILDHNMIIDLPGSKGILKNISVVKDTMYFLDEQGGLIKGYRFKLIKNN